VRRATLRAAKALFLSVAALAAVPPSARAVLDIEQPWNACSDSYELKNIAFDARMTAVMMYYRGFVQNAGDPGRQECLKAHVLKDGHFAVINRTMLLIDTECLPIEVAAQKATQGLCP
jgi:hypothetical protein